MLYLLYSIEPCLNLSLMVFWKLLRRVIGVIGNFPKATALCSGLRRAHGQRAWNIASRAPFDWYILVILIQIGRMSSGLVRGYDPYLVFCLHWQTVESNTVGGSLLLNTPLCLSYCLVLTLYVLSGAARRTDETEFHQDTANIKWSVVFVSAILHRFSTVSMGLALPFWNSW